MIKTISLFVFILRFSFAFSQVVNNQINERFDLKLDSDPISSTTSNSSVEWQCINKALTNKCLVYHNDQWFTFQVEKAGNYYLNLSSQQCKNLQGLQVILIEGNPCEIKSYSVLQCIPKISQDDTFIELPSIKENTNYLLNIDGFLGDFCEFEIQLSSRPLGIPLQFNRSDSVQANLSMTDKQIILNWKAAPELLQSIETFRVGRKKEKGAKSKWTDVNVKANAYGQLLTDYSLIDTLTEQGNFIYSILGLKISDGYPILLFEKKISYWEKGELKTPASQSYIFFSPEVKKLSGLQIVVLDADTDAVINYLNINYDPKKSKNIALSVSELLKAGVKNCTIQIKNQKTLQIQNLFYKLNEDGVFTLVTPKQ
jgi:hypothetical protein